MSWTALNRRKRTQCKYCGRRTVCNNHVCMHCSNWLFWETYHAEDDDEDDEDDDDEYEEDEED